MKFLCSNCKAKYQIPDEKIAGRTLKMDCRRCNTPITIRGDQPQVEELDADPIEEEPRRAPIADDCGMPQRAQVVAIFARDVAEGRVAHRTRCGHARVP